VADYYTDARRRPLIPQAIVAEFEPHWRSLNHNRPHRMGGYHDGLQSDAENRTTSKDSLSRKHS